MENRQETVNHSTETKVKVDFDDGMSTNADIKGKSASSYQIFELDESELEFLTRSLNTKFRPRNWSTSATNDSKFLNDEANTPKSFNLNQDESLKSDKVQIKSYYDKSNDFVNYLDDPENINIKKQDTEDMVNKDSDKMHYSNKTSTYNYSPSPNNIKSKKRNNNNNRRSYSVERRHSTVKNSKFPSNNNTVSQLDEYKKSGLYKTDLCRTYSLIGSCPYGKKCQFAHGKRELRETPKSEKYKTQECMMFLADRSCPFGSRCAFIHDKTERRILKNSSSTIEDKLASKKFESVVPMKEGKVLHFKLKNIKSNDSKSGEKKSLVFQKGKYDHIDMDQVPDFMSRRVSEPTLPELNKMKKLRSNSN